MSIESPRSRIAPLAEEQWGLITRRQAIDLGIAATTWERLIGPGGALRRVGYGVYQLAGAPQPDHLELRAAWLQLAPRVPAWEREPTDGVVSHRSAADLYGVGDLPADAHDFTVGRRRQSRQREIRFHTRRLSDAESILLRGLPVTRPSRIASDLLFEHEDPGAVAHVISDSILAVYDYPGAFADALAAHAHRFGLRRDDGLGLLGWLLELVGDRDTSLWMDQARAQQGRSVGAERAPRPRSREGSMP